MPFEEHARAPRVLAEDDVRLAKLLEHAQSDVPEVADGSRADRERHVAPAPLPGPVERLEPDERGAHQPRVGAEPRRDDP